METQILVTKQEPCIVYKRKDLANTTTTSVKETFLSDTRSVSH